MAEDEARNVVQYHVDAFLSGASVTSKIVLSAGDSVSSNGKEARVRVHRSSSVPEGPHGLVCSDTELIALAERMQQELDVRERWVRP